jgi:hypothetical protein
MKTFVTSLIYLFISLQAFSQEVNKNADSFQVARDKEIPREPLKIIQDGLSTTEKNPFLIYTGKTIRSVRIKSLGFETDINDTTLLKGGLGVALGDALHKTTRLPVITNNLFFKEGDKVNPYLLADNERFLRDLVYIQDAVIIVKRTPDDISAVDILVMIKDVFSFGPGVGIGGTKKYKLELKEENLGGTGTKIAASTLFDANRQPKFGWGAEYLSRNVRGSFINWGMGFKNYNNAFNSNRNEENIYYIKIEKPLVSQYLRWMGSFDLSFNKTSNAYLSDSLYKSDFKYSYYNIDGWFAYVFGSRQRMYSNLKSTTREFIAVRGFNQHFNDIPDKNDINYDGTYSNAAGMLASLSIFKQNYFRATYIYGFGRNEDVPEGFSASVIGGYSTRKDSLYDKSRRRPYYGIDVQRGKFNYKGFYSGYTFRLGGHLYNHKWEDVNLLMNVDHFTRLKQINSRWYKRYFFSGGFAKQFVPVLDQALLLRSPFGLPYFEYGYVSADLRATVKSEMVYYHTKRFLGFGFAPFAFADIILLKPTKQNFSKSDIYSGLGTGFRIRNENLIFGTIEARFSYFPRILPNMNHFKIKFNTNLRYRYNSSFIRRPDFVSPNTLL